MKTRTSISTLILCSLVACASTDDTSPEGPLSPWIGTWTSGDSLFRDAALDPVYEIISGMRPDYTADEVRALMLDRAAVEFRELHIESDMMRFSSTEGVLCEGRYASAGSDEEGHHARSEFELVEESGGNCDDYARVWLTDLLGEMPNVHIHLTHGDADGPLRPPPWDPSAWAASVTPSVLAELMHGAAPAIADGLPEK